jgi:hypothetical protein
MLADEAAAEETVDDYEISMVKALLFDAIGARLRLLALMSAVDIEWYRCQFLEFGASLRQLTVYVVLNLELLFSPIIPIC